MTSDGGPVDEREAQDAFAVPELVLAPGDPGKANKDSRLLASSRENALGVAGSFILHAVVLFFLFASLRTPLPIETLLRVLPVDLVALNEETASPPLARTAPVPQQQRAALPQPLPSQPATTRSVSAARSQDLASLSPPADVAPNTRQPLPEPSPSDPLQEKLEALANLRLSDTDTRLLDSLSNISATSDGARLGPRATYSVHDYVRAQVERRWSLDIDSLRNHDIVVSLHVVLDFDGTVKEAEIVDRKRFQEDAAYYSVALSARNAVLLASPLALPAGAGKEALDMVLNFSPRNVLR